MHLLSAKASKLPNHCSLSGSLLTPLYFTLYVQYLLPLVSMIQYITLALFLRVHILLPV